MDRNSWWKSLLLRVGGASLQRLEDGLGGNIDTSMRAGIAFDPSRDEKYHRQRELGRQVVPLSLPPSMVKGDALVPPPGKPMPTYNPPLQKPELQLTPPPAVVQSSVDVPPLRPSPQAMSQIVDPSATRSRYALTPPAKPTPPVGAQVGLNVRPPVADDWGQDVLGSVELSPPPLSRDDALRTRAREVAPPTALERAVDNRAIRAARPARDNNGRGRSTAAGAWRGFQRGGLIGAIVGAARSAIDKDSDEFDVKQEELAQFDREIGREAKTEDVLTQLAQRRALTAATLRKPQDEEAKRQAAQVQRDRQALYRTLQMSRGQRLSPEIISRAAQLGVLINDPEQWATSDSVNVTITDPENPQVKILGRFDKSTGEVTRATQAGSDKPVQTGFQQPVGADGQTAAQRAANEDRDRNFEQRLRDYDLRVTNGMSRAAVQTFRIQTADATKQLGAIERALDTWRKNDAAGIYDSGVADRHIAELVEQRNTIKAQIERAREAALQGIGTGAPPPVRRGDGRRRNGEPITTAPPSGRGKYTGQTFQRSDLPSLRSFFPSKSDAEIESLIIQNGGTFR